MSRLGICIFGIFAFMSSVLSFAATGFEYQSDEHTLGLWHFNEGQGNAVKDASKNKIKTVVEGKAKWDKANWNKAGGGHSLVFDGKTALAIPIKDTVGNKILTPDQAITIEAWVYPTDLTAWKLVGAHWAGAVGKYHFGVSNGVPNMHVNTDKGTKNAKAPKIEINKWYHLAGSYDGKEIKIYVDGKLSEAVAHSGKLTTGSPWDVMIGTKASREFHWVGLMDEVRFSSVARKAEELSPNLASGPTPVDLDSTKLPVFWANMKQR